MTGAGAPVWTWFWLGRSANAVAVEVTVFSIPVLATVAIGASTGEVAAIVTVELLAGLAGPLLLAGWFDSHSSRAVLLGADLVRAAVVVLITLAAVTVGPSVPLLAVAAFVLGVLRFTGMGATFVAVTRLVPDSGLERANAQLEGGRRLASTSGPLLAGALVTSFGAVWAPAVEGLVLLATAAALLMIPPLPPISEGAGRRLNGPAAIRAGLRTIAASPALRAVSGAAAVFNAIVAGTLVLIPLLVLRELGVSPIGLGIGLGVGATGGILGAIVAPRVLRRWSPGQVMPASLVLAGLALLPLVLWRGGATSAAAVFAVAEFVFAVSTTLFIVPNSVIRQRATPKAAMGRTTSAYMLLTRGAAPVGAAAVGWLADATSLRAAFAMAIVVQVGAGIWLHVARASLQDVADVGASGA